MNHRHGISTRKAAQVASVVLVLATLSGERAAKAIGATNWVTGAGLQKRLARRVTIVWSRNPLRHALGNLSRTQQVAVLIDRRLDPSQKLQLRLEEVPLRAALEAIARTGRLGVTRLESVVYFGPRRVSSQLRTIAALRAEEIRQLPAPVGRKFFRSRRIAWSDFATPRDLLEQLARANGLTLAGLSRVPHDLWAAADLPPLSLIGRLTLIAIEFDLTFEVSADGRTVTLVAVPAEVGLVRSYPGGPQPELTAERFAATVPNARIKVVGREVSVTGLLEEHERLRSRRKLPRLGGPAAAPDIGTTRIKGKVSFQEEPLGVVLEELAAWLHFELVIDRAALERAGVSLQQRVSFSVENVSVDELLTEVIRPTRLKFSRRGNVVEIGPAE